MEKKEAVTGMEIKEENFCRICLKTGDLEVVDESIKEIFDALLLNFDFLLTDHPTICTSCYDKLRICYDFKTTYMSVKDRVVDFSTGNNFKVALEDAYLDDTINRNDEFYTSCRFCGQYVENKTCMTLDVVEKNVVLTKGSLAAYIPEIELSATERPVICSFCLESLQCYVNLRTACWDLEEKIKGYLETTCRGSESQVRFNDVVKFIFEDAVKQEFENVHSMLVKEESEDVTVDNGIYLKEQHVDIKEEDSEVATSTYTSSGYAGLDMSVTNPPADKQTFRCIACKYEAKCQSLLNCHLLTHRLYKCGTCEFKTKTMHNVKRHETKHSEIETRVAPTYTCEICNYETKVKTVLDNHMLVHGKREKTTFECDKCSFKTDRKFNFTRHVACHLPINETATFLCDVCSYRGKDKSVFKRHMYTHNVTAGLTLFHCDTCSYVSPKQDHLRRHKRIHENKSVQWYKCEYCDFKTDHGYSLRNHRREHTPVDSLGNLVFKCRFCVYETKRSFHYQRHMLIHQDTKRRSGKYYICHTCTYKTIQKYNLIRHLKTHKPPVEDEVQVIFKCDKCNYETKQKGHLNRHSKTHE